MTSRRGRGEDSVYLDGDRWRGAASLGYGPDGRRIRKKVSGATKAEVLRKLRDLRSELNAGDVWGALFSGLRHASLVIGELNGIRGGSRRTLSWTPELR